MQDSVTVFGRSTMMFGNNDMDMIHYWAHMLDESRHTSYYDVYMQEHPEDQLPRLVDSMLEEFADSLEKDHIDLTKGIVDGYATTDSMMDIAKQLKHKYYWERIKAQTYGAIISRMTALLHRAKSAQFNEEDIGFDDVAHLVSRKTVEDCLDIMCHNTNVLEANNSILLDAFDGSPVYGELFKKHGIPALPRHDKWHSKDVEDYLMPLTVYRAWAAYAKGNAGEPYVCDSDNGPEQLKKVLDSVDYSASTVDLVVALNKSLDIVHFRSDLAAAFIEGGQQTCAIVSNLPDKFVI